MFLVYSHNAHNLNTKRMSISCFAFFYAAEDREQTSRLIVNESSLFLALMYSRIGLLITPRKTHRSCCCEDGKHIYPTQTAWVSMNQQQALGGHYLLLEYITQCTCNTLMLIDFLRLQ